MTLYLTMRIICPTSSSIRGNRSYTSFLAYIATKRCLIPNTGKNLQRFKRTGYIYINQQLVHEFIDNRILDSSINRLLPHTPAIKELYAIKQISFISVLTNQDGVRDCLAFLRKAIAHRQYLRIILLIARKKQGEERQHIPHKMLHQKRADHPYSHAPCSAGQRLHDEAEQRFEKQHAWEDRCIQDGED